MPEREYSKLLGTLRTDQLQAALTRFDLGELVRAEPISFGLFGQNLFVTSTQGEFVLRGAPHYAWQFPTEKFFADQLHAHTRVPVPHPYWYEPAEDIFGWGFCLMPKMPGLEIADEKLARALAPEDRRGIARALASTLAEAQTLTHPFSGRYDYLEGKVVPMETAYRTRIVERVRELLREAQGVNANTPDSDLIWAEQILGAAAGALDTLFQPCIVLEDYKEPNTLVERTAQGWRVSGVFDLMTAHFGDGEADLARQVGMYLREDPALADVFVAEYLRRVTPAPGFAGRQQVYMLYDSALIWTFWQRHAGGFPEDKTLTLQSWAAPFIEY